jgi:hypothetical protein
VGDRLARRAGSSARLRLAYVTLLFGVIGTPPNEIRGLSVAVSSLINIGLGLALGAALPALVMEHVIHDAQAVGTAMTLVALPAAIASTLLYRRALTRIAEVTSA